MNIFRSILKFMGVIGSTYIHKYDLGNGYKRIRAKRETDSFALFKHHGQIYVALKSVAPRIDNRGNIHHSFFESDVHTFNPDSKEVLSSALMKEFKKRLAEHELEEFEEIMEEARNEAIAERAREIYATFDIIEDISDGKQKPEDLVKTIDMNLPRIRIAKTRQIEIESMTPHETVNEFISMAMEGTILSSLFKPKKFDRAMVIGILTVGISIGWILVILYAVMFPDQWAILVGNR